MPYVGLTIYFEEAARLLKIDPEISRSSYWDISPVQKHLTAAGSKLVFEYVDKDVCVLGIEFPLSAYHPTMFSIDDALQLMLEMKKTFKAEMERFGADLSKVTIAQMESPSIIMENPEPFVCFF